MRPITLNSPKPLWLVVVQRGLLVLACLAIAAMVHFDQVMDHFPDRTYRELRQIEFLLNPMLNAALGGAVGAMIGRFWAGLAVGFVITATLLVAVSGLLGP